MTTLITVGSSDGTTGRCDEKCYNAVYVKCTCCCGGKNHGVGRRQAEANTREMAEEWIKASCKEHGIEATSIEIPQRLRQQTLF